MTEWKPFSTAPIGRPVLLAYKEFVVVGEVEKWVNATGKETVNIKPHGFSGYDWDWDWGYGVPTHWAERPEGPKS